MRNFALVLLISFGDNVQVNGMYITQTSLNLHMQSKKLVHSRTAIYMYEL